MPGFESDDHKELKEEAKKYLEDLGNKTILFEQKVIEGKYINKVDVFAEDQNIVAECGNKPALDWISELLSKANKVLWFGYCNQIYEYSKNNGEIKTIIIRQPTQFVLEIFKKMVWVSKANSIVIPKAFRDILNIKSGIPLVIQLEDDGTLIIKPKLKRLEE